MKFISLLQRIQSIERFFCRTFCNFNENVSNNSFNVNSFCQRTYNCGELRLTHKGIFYCFFNLFRLIERVL